MGVLILRILLVALPVLALVLWLRARASKADEAKSAEDRMAEDRALLKKLLGLFLLLLVAGFLLYSLDDARAPAGQDYVPPHMKDGQLVPGQFKERQVEPIKEEGETEPPKAEPNGDKDG